MERAFYHEGEEYSYRLMTNTEEDPSHAGNIGASGSAAHDRTICRMIRNPDNLPVRWMPVHPDLCMAEILFRKEG